ncbi:MAG: family 78 glycoside hydrolase catalytic domain [Micromonosporaceae bacterium]
MRVWTEDGTGSPWSAVATFETGPLDVDDWGGAAWIGGGSLLRKEFRLSGDRVVRARLYFCGLGFGEPHLDGARVGSRVLDPAPTNYDKTVLFTTYDVTERLGPSADADPDAVHVLGAMLGGGRYDEPTVNAWHWERAPWRDRPKLLAQLMIWYADGATQRVVTDGGWQVASGPIRSDSLYAGEIYDARLARPGWTSAGYDAAGWSPAEFPSPPRGRLRSQQLPPIEPIRSVAPVGLAEPTAGVYVYDLGEQLAGWARMSLSGPPGTAVRIRYGERLLDSGEVDIAQPYIQADMQSDTYIIGNDGPEVYEPRFSYKGFQYVEVAGLPGRPALSDLLGIVVHTAVRSTAEFECDSEDVNRLHVGARKALLNNLHGIPTDTPVFEKNGWTGDAHLTAEMAAYNFEMASFWTKWLQDWADAQLPSGEVPPIVPTPGWGYRGNPAGVIGPIPAWDVAYFEIPWVMYRYYGDRRVLERHYDGQRRYLDYLVSGFLEPGEEGVVLVGLGDYLPPGVHDGIPPEGPGVYETAYTHRILGLLRSIAVVLGRESDLSAYDELAAKVFDGFNRTFFDATTVTYHGENPAEYRQSPNVVALSFGLVPTQQRAAVLDRLVADIHERDDHLNTGVIGTKFLFPLLTRNGHVDLAYKVALQRTYPGYGHWLELGATALYEMWDAKSRSRNHHFFGHVDRWFVEDLAGVSPLEPGYAKVRIAPCPPAQLGFTRVALDTVSGRIESAWRRRRDGGIDLTCSLPPGVTAEVDAPGDPRLNAGHVRGTPAPGSPADSGASGPGTGG